MRALELLGRRFERLLVLSRAGIDNHGKVTWLCRCDCGTEKIINGSSLKRGLTQSCGCFSSEKSKQPRTKRLKLEGQRVGRLTVLAREKSDDRGNSSWRCKCSCGTEKVVKARDIQSGDTKSCGCLRKEQSTKRARERKADKNPKWKGGITPVNHRIRNSEEYKNWRKAVFARDGFRCRECGGSSPFNVHHIKSFAYFPELRFEISNGVTLCIPCHKKTPNYLKDVKI